MELRQLRHFTAVALHGNFSKAAKQLNLTQPALSRQVKSLEAELGVPLFKRESNRISLTSSGKLFYEYARELLAKLEQKVVEIRKQKHEPCRVGYLPAFVVGVLPYVLSRLRAEGDAVAPELLDLTAQEIVTQAVAGKLDVAILPKDLETAVPTFQWTTLRRLRPILIMHKRHPLAKQKRVSPKQLIGVSLHGLGENFFPEYAPRLRGMLKPFGVKPSFVSQTADGTPTLFAAIEADLGAAVLSEGVANRLPSTLVARPFGPALSPMEVIIGLPVVQPKAQAEKLVALFLEGAQRLRRRQH